MQIELTAGMISMLDEEKVELLRQMMRIRAVEEAVADRYSEQEMRCPVHLSIGQEAVAAGVCSILKKEDYAFSGHRCHAHYLAKGGCLKSMIAELYGKETGCSGGRGGSMHLVDIETGFLGAAPIVGSTIAIATGAAFGVSMRKEERVVVVFFGDGATEEGVFSESLNFAALKNLPILFVCENNLYSVYSPLEVRQPPNRDNAMIARGHGLEALCGDGNNVFEVNKLTGRALDFIKNNKKPVFMELSTYRWREHCGPNYDNDLGYRAIDEFESWKKRCPISILQKELTDSGLITAEQLNTMRNTIYSEIEEAFDFAKQSPFPSPASLMNGVFSSGEAGR